MILLADKLISENSFTKEPLHIEDVVVCLNKDIKMLIGKLFSALEDEGINPWMNEGCMEIANKHRYTVEDYKKYLSTIM